MSKIIELAQKQIIRNNILKILDELGDTGASTILLKKGLQTLGIDVRSKDIDTELAYLKGKHVLDIQNIENKVLGIKRDMVKITPLGMDLLDGITQIEGIEIELEDGE